MWTNLVVDDQHSTLIGLIKNIFAFDDFSIIRQAYFFFDVGVDEKGLTLSR